jgi:hypothetical protein
MTPQIYCDMDGVLANFVTAAERFFEVDIRGHSDATFKKLWDSPQGSARLAKEWPTFWMDLPMLPHAQQLWSVIGPLHSSILTAAPSNWPSAGTGKLIWCKRHLHNFRPSMNKFHAVRRSEKRRFAKQRDGTANILIDDFAKNINEWQQAGGVGVVYQDGDIAHVKKVVHQLI